MNHRTQNWAALVGSFAVYLIPLVGPHAFWLLGETLVIDLASGRPWAWKTIDLTVGLLIQALTWLVLRWSLAGGIVRKLSWLAVVPIVSGLNLVYLVIIPSYFLIEPDTAPERSTWVEHCFVPRASLLAVRSGVTQSPAGISAWWSQTPEATYELLRMPECTATDSSMPRPTVQPGGRVDFLLGFHFATPEGVAVIETTVPSTGERSWSLLTEPGSQLRRLSVPSQVDGPPILSAQGDVLAWMQRVSGAGPPVRQRVVIRTAVDELATTEGDIVVELAPLGPASYTLLDVDSKARELTLWRNDRPVAVGFDGQMHRLPFQAGDLRPQGSTYLRHGVGWMAWDAYREEGAYQLTWSLHGHDGSRRVNAGRSITSAAVDPAGRFVAVSETTALSIGNAMDVVSVFRTDTGAEVFRRYLPRYARSTVVFFEGSLFAYSDLDGTHVLAMGDGAP